jgi:hypothetical protein
MRCLAPNPLAANPLAPNLKRRRSVAAWLFAGWLIVAAAPAAATSAQLVNLQVALDEESILVSFDLTGAFDERLVERLESGLPTELIYDLRLARDRQWFDKGLERCRLTLVAMYDAVRNEYLLNLKQDGQLRESRVVTDLAALERAMTHLERFPAFKIGDRTHKDRMLVKARAELGTRNLLSLIPVSITTDWVDSRKFRPPREDPPKER